MLGEEHERKDVNPDAKHLQWIRDFLLNKIDKSQLKRKLPVDVQYHNKIIKKILHNSLSQVPFKNTKESIQPKVLEELKYVECPSYKNSESPPLIIQELKVIQHNHINVLASFIANDTGIEKIDPNVTSFLIEALDVYLKGILSTVIKVVSLDSDDEFPQSKNLRRNLITPDIMACALQMNPSVVIGNVQWFERALNKN